MKTELTIEKLNSLFGRPKSISAITGYIPIAFFTENEKEIRSTMKLHGLKAIYRGPRKSNRCLNPPSMTRRCDANFAVLYYK